MATVTHTLPTNYDSNGSLYPTHLLIAGQGQSAGSSVTLAYYTIAAWTTYSNPMIWYDATDQKWYDMNSPDAEPVYIVGTNTFSVPTSGWGEVTTANPQYVYIGNQTNGSGFHHGFENPYYTAPPSLTITAINRLTPWTTTVNDGVNPPVSYHLEGEIVTNDTLTSSDVTLAKDFASYANSNLTLYQPSSGKFFGISKPSDGLYHIAVGDKHNDYLHIDDSWRNTITSSSSTRTTNSDRILNVIATIPLNAKIYVRVRKNALPHQTAFGPWSEWQAVGSDRHRLEHKLVYSGTNTTGPAYTQYGGPSDIRLSFVLGTMQDANGDDQIGGRFILHKWRQDDYFNGFNYVGPLIEMGAQSSILSAKFTNDPNTAPYDKFFQKFVSDDWQYQYRIDDWLYHNEPEGDGDETTQTCDHEYANCRRRRAHSFW